MKLSAIKVDPRIETEGAWVKNIPGMDDLELKVRPAGCDEAIRVNRQAINRIPVAARAAGIDPEQERAINTEVAWRALLVDWKNLSDDKPIAYSQALAQSLLEDPQYRDLLGAVLYAASVVREQGSVDLEAAEKN